MADKDDEYIVGVWFAGFAGMILLAELNRRPPDAHALRIRLWYGGDTHKYNILILDDREDVAHAAAAHRIEQTVRQAPMPVVTPLEYTPIGGDRGVWFEKLQDKSWFKGHSWRVEE